MRWALVLLVLAGCGRVAFDPLDATACAPVGHDEDGDGLDDACDPCPHIAGDAADGDGDGVGDACDPDGSAYTNVMMALASGSITSGRARITMQNAFPHIICTGEWNGQQLRAEGDVPTTLTGTQHYFAANNVDVSLRSAVRIATRP